METGTMPLIVINQTWTSTSATTAIGNDGRNFVFNDPVQRIILAVIFIIAFFVGFTGNGLTMLAVGLSRKLRTITNVFVVNLAIADLLTCCVLPWNTVALLSFSGWPLPDWVCAGAALVLYTCGGCSLYSLATIAINRYIIITRPLRTYRAIYTKRNIAIILTICWLVPFSVSLIPPLCGLGELGYAVKYKTCSHKTTHPLSDYYSMLQAAVLYPVPLIIIVVCYVKIFNHTRRHMKTMTMSESSDTSVSNTKRSSPNGTPHNESKSVRKRLNKRQVEITKNMLFVVCAFGLCASPYCVSLMIPPSDPAIPWTAAILLFNSCVNPFIYATKHPYFKQVFGFMLKCQCTKIPEQASIIRTISSMHSSYRSTRRKNRKSATQSCTSNSATEVAV
ncbi:alpha-1D adrenergic receptor-like [Lytechinus pictus]|uniref:alpha-1D adrenergic receptor-like n=1 Tax=Lytechinus pictus TaxID=7653 RepID=UPI00240E4C11|nr:alpha-1D adrenergic receptor-like [Lytechinus pictus]